jgi:hypothetical protein
MNVSGGRSSAYQVYPVQRRGIDSVEYDAIVAAFLSMRATGKTSGFIAYRIGRSVDACLARLRYLRLRNGESQ